MAEVLRYVNTASSGGDGTGGQDVVSGATAAYVSMQAAETANDQDLVTAGNYFVASCVGSAADTNSLTVAGWVTGASNYVEFRTPVGHANGRHQGLYPASTYYRLETVSSGIAAFDIQTEYCRVIGVPVQKSKDGSTDKNAFRIPSGINAGEIRLLKCIAHGNWLSNTGVFNGFLMEDSSPTLIINNCLSYDFGDASGIGYAFGSFGVCYVYNCGAHNCITGFGGSGTLTDTHLRNCWAQTCTTYYASGWNSASNYNISEGTGAPGANSKNSTAISFTNEGADDFSLASGDTAAKNAGESLSGVTGWITNEDIMEISRPQGSAWDIGPFETEEAAATATNFLGLLGIGHG